MQRAIRQMSTHGLLVGVSPGQFAPDGPVTRAQMAALLSRTLAIYNANARSPFEDVHPFDWFYSVVGTVQQHNLMFGTSPDTFDPDVVIPREQVMALAARVLQQEMGHPLPGNPTLYLAEFADRHEISDWARAVVALTTRENLPLRRADANFLPTQSMTRGELAIIWNRLYARMW
jgi:hypothetical protein